VGQSFLREGQPPALHLRVLVALAVVVLDVAHDADRAVVTAAAVLDVITGTPVERVVAGVALEVVVAVIPLQVVGTAATACWTPRSSPSNYERPLGNLISAGEWWGVKSP
jgi:hypothetical protein